MDKYVSVTVADPPRSRNRRQFHDSVPHSRLNVTRTPSAPDLSDDESENDSGSLNYDAAVDGQESDESATEESEQSESSRSSTPSSRSRSSSPSSRSRSSSPSNPPTPPHRPGIGLADKDRTVYLSMHHLHYGTSREEGQRTADLAEIMTNTVPSVTFDQHVRPFLATVFREFNYKKMYFCPDCDGQLTTHFSSCQFANCDLYDIPRKRSKAMTCSEVHLLDTHNQLMDILEEKKGEIVQFHGMLHHMHANQLVTDDRSDTRYYPHYYSSIESPQDYNNHILDVNLSISSDGFVPKRLSKSEGWPLYVRFECLSREDKENYFNSCLAGMLYVKGDPRETLLASLSARFRREMNDFEMLPPTFLINGVQWTFRIKIMCGLFDLAGQKDLFGLPRWNSELGCSKCENPGYRHGGKRVWFSAQPGQYTRRTPASIRADGLAGQNGVAELTSFMELTTPDLCPGDWLHLVSEGVSRDRYRDITKPNTQMPGIRIVLDDWNRLTDTLNGIQNYTYSQKFVLGVTDATKCTGNEFDQICDVLLPLAGARNLMPDELSAVGLIGYWALLRSLSDIRSLTVERLQQIKSLSSDVRMLWGELCVSAFTMKCHLLFDHIIRDDLLRVGSPKQWSTAGFESLHRRLQINVNQATTNSHTALIERFVTTKKVYRLFKKMTLRTRNPLCLALLQKVENQHVDRLPMGEDGYVVSDDCYVPTQSTVEGNLLQAAHIPLLANVANLAEFSSRLVVSDQVYASIVYRERANLTTQQNIVCYTVDGQTDVFFGSIVLFVNLPAARRSIMLIDEFDLRCPFESLQISVGSMPPGVVVFSALSALDSTTLLNNYFKKVVGSVLKLRDATRILSPAVVMEYCDVNGQTFSYVSKC